jgi:hypothetical protein
MEQSELLCSSLWLRTLNNSGSHSEKEKHVRRILGMLGMLLTREDRNTSILYVL